MEEFPAREKDEPGRFIFSGKPAGGRLRRKEKAVVKVRHDHLGLKALAFRNLFNDGSPSGDFALIGRGKVDLMPFFLPVGDLLKRRFSSFLFDL